MAKLLVCICSMILIITMDAMLNHHAAISRRLCMILLTRSSYTAFIHFSSSIREKLRRETRLINMLQFVVSVCWKALFGKAADALERSTANENECNHNLFVSL